MGQVRQLQEVRLMVFEDVYNLFQEKRLGCDEAVAILGTSASTFFRMRRHYEDYGPAGLVDGRLDKASASCLLKKSFYCRQITL